MCLVYNICHHRTPTIFKVEHFWISASITSFCLRKEKTESRRQEVKTFRGTNSRVVGLKLGSSLLSVLSTKTVQTFFQFARIWPNSQITRNMSVKNDLSYGHLLRDIMDILFRGRREPDVFILRITLVTFS